MDNKLKKQIIGFLIIAGIVISGMWLAKQNKKEVEVMPEITLESSKQMESDVNLQLPLTEVEKQEIEEVFVTEGVEMTVLEDVAGGQAIGTAWRQFSNDKFFHKVEVNGLLALEKGFFYEGWLVGDKGFFSTGRMGEEVGKGVLYYTVEEDKGDFRGVVITLEPEDGDSTPAKHVLEGSF